MRETLLDELEKRGVEVKYDMRCASSPENEDGRRRQSLLRDRGNGRD